MQSNGNIEFVKRKGLEANDLGYCWDMMLSKKRSVGLSLPAILYICRQPECVNPALQTNTGIC